jgi:NAD(P)H-dependent FMN reductase
MADRPYSVPVILGTPRRRRRSEGVARLILDELRKRPAVETEIIDVRDLAFATDDAGEDLKDPGFSERMSRADALVLVVPEYNHGYPGLLKHALDTNLKEYIHKAVGVAGVTTGPFGGTRVVENLLPVLRELGLVTIFWDVNVDRVQHAFDEDGRLLDEAYLRRVAKFLDELLWMARVLRHGREQVPSEDMPAGPTVDCPRCGTFMNPQGEKLVLVEPEEGEEVDPVLGGVVRRLYACPECGFVDARPAGAEG